MKIDVLLGEAPVAPADVADRVVVVIDVLRAATTAATALANGARMLIPFESVEEAAQRAKTMDQESVRLGGERRMVRVPGFDFGNSPLEYTADVVAGRTIVFTTTNGTLALTSTHGARVCFFAGFVNAQASVTAMCRASGGTVDMTIVCAGTDRHLALEDAVCAGRLVRGVLDAFPETECGDAARLVDAIAQSYHEDMAALIADSSHARALTTAGFDADVACCFAIDSVPVAVRYHDRQLQSLHAGSA
ncbi:MAG: 2-phosphosulfolactate phosphatase [Gemmatimonadaceae bacterium]|nr:2-phosphosulfolactate phosphatase [Gemmatimonadaceae bacterium]